MLSAQVDEELDGSVTNTAEGATVDDSRQNPAWRDPGRPVASRTADPAIRATRAFFDFLLPPPRDFTVRLWDGSEFGAEEGNRYTVALKGPASTRRMFDLPIELALGEALIFGDFDIGGDFFAALGLKDRARASVASPAKLLNLLRLRQKLPSATNDREGRHRARLSGRLNTRRRDKDAIQYHYDVGNDFFALWLDDRMIYTCAYFPSGTEDLATAQELKLEHICRKLRLRKGERVLDIGCGWGGFCIYAAQKYGVASVGVTLSRRQHDFAAARVVELGLDHLIDIRLQDYRDVPDTFDKIVSIGMFEAVGLDFPGYFRQVYRMLRPGGLFLNHSIAASASAEAWATHSAPRRFLQRSILGTGLIRERYIFPDGRLMPVSEANLTAERAGFEVRDVENLREHYALTLRTWLARLDARKDDALKVADDTVYRTWRLYMTAAALEFEKGTVNINQTLFERPLPGIHAVPATRADLYT